MNTTYVGAGIVLGLCAGIVLGVVLEDKGKGIALGLSFGVVIGALLGRRKSKEKNESHHP